MLWPPGFTFLSFNSVASTLYKVYLGSGHSYMHLMKTLILSIILLFSIISVIFNLLLCHLCEHLRLPIWSHLKKKMFRMSIFSVQCWIKSTRNPIWSCGWDIGSSVSQEIKEQIVNWCNKRYSRFGSKRIAVDGRGRGPFSSHVVLWPWRKNNTSKCRRNTWEPKKQAHS